MILSAIQRRNDESLILSRLLTSSRVIKMSLSIDLKSPKIVRGGKTANYGDAQRWDAAVVEGWSPESDGGGWFDAHPAIIAANRPSIACNERMHRSWRVGIVAPRISRAYPHATYVLESIAKKLTFELKAGLMAVNEFGPIIQLTGGRFLLVDKLSKGLLFGPKVGNSLPDLV